MQFVYGPQDMKDLISAQKNCWLLTNGLGGYMSTTAAYGVNRCDHGLFIAAESAPNKRNMMVHRMKEMLLFPERAAEEKQFGIYLSTQEFAGMGDRRSPVTGEDGFRHLTSFIVDGIPEWNYFYQGISVRRRCIMAYGKNTAAVEYVIDNQGAEDTVLQLTPFMTFLPKGQVPVKEEELEFVPQIKSRNEIIISGISTRIKGDKTEAEAEEQTGLHMRLCTNGEILENTDPGKCRIEHLYYAFDERDGRQESGLAAACCRIQAEVPVGSRKKIVVIFSTEYAEDRKNSKLCELITGKEKDKICQWKSNACNPAANADPTSENILQRVEQMFRQYEKRRGEWILASGLQDPVAQQLVMAAADFISEKESTGGKTLLAGYPFFGDWGRDTMISLPGCTLATGQYDTARSILKTFLSYEKDGLVPNLFPDGNEAPMYNSVDAPLLLINGMWLYEQATGDLTFSEEAYPVMERIIHAYENGTKFGIHMEEDGLIAAGCGKNQLTWMDICVDGFLPTPRHGKPVEINAYWYNALCIMAEIGERCDIRLQNPQHYRKLAACAKESFLQKFLHEYEKNSSEISGNHGLRDLVSGTPADEQIRCNQIWAVTLPFTMLSSGQEAAVVAEVYRYLYTSGGLRTLNPQDPDFHPFYGGSLYSRDTAYHQGTVWVFPLGAFYLAWLKMKGETKKAAAEVRTMLASMESMLREGCIGQLPEIYDGLYPTESRGCFAQAWSVGEILRVYQKLEQIEKQ